MIENRPLYNSKICLHYVSYLQTHYPNINVDELLASADMTMEQVQDPSHWFTHAQMITFHHLAQKKTGEQRLAYYVGKSIAPSESLGLIKNTILGMVNPARAFRAIETIYPKMNQATFVRVREFSRNHVVVITRPKPGVNEEPFQCQFRIGNFEAISKLFTDYYAHVSQSRCLHDGDDECEYTITWKNLWSGRVRRALKLLIFLSVLAAGALLFFLTVRQMLPVILGMLLFNLAWALAALKLKNIEYARTIQQQGSVANEMIKQANERYNNALLSQEIGQAITVALDESEITRSFMSVMEKRLDFDRGFIMLLDADGKELRFSAQFGFTDKPALELEKISARAEQFAQHPIFKRTLVEQQPFITNNFKKENFTGNHDFIAFVEQLQTHAAIVVPIIYGKKPLGILAVDNVKSQHLFTQTDVFLLQGIAAEIAISLANMFTFKKQIKGEQRYSLLVAHMPIGLMTIDYDGYITNVNPKMAEMLGAPGDEIVGRLISDLKQCTDTPLTNTYPGILLDGQPMSFQHSMTSRNGKTFDLLCYLIPIRDSASNVSEIQVMAQDITEMNRMEAQLHQAQKMESIGTLAGGVAHDFNNILSAIIGFTELAMKEQPPESRLYGQLSNILKASGRARDIVQQILLFSRRTEIDFRPLRMDVVVKDAIKLLRAFLPANIEIKLLLTPAPAVFSDVTQIHQILMNLASNAAFAMGDGGGTLTIRIEPVNVREDTTENNVAIAAGDYVLLAVSDTGGGIDPDLLNRIFDPFFTTKERGEGTGMGLSVVHGIMRSQNGIINVESNLGKGTTFRLYFPAQDAQPEAQPVAPLDLPSGGGHILFVDDEPLITEFAAEMLTSLGYNVTVKTDGHDALDFFESNMEKIDLLITDLTMPKLAGDKLAAMALKLKPALPVILMTGFSEHMNPDRAQTMGIRHFVYKPFNVQEMATLISKILDNKEKATT